MSHPLSFHSNQILSPVSVVWLTISLLASWESNTVCHANHHVQQQRTSQCLCGRVSPEILVLNTKSHLKQYVVNGFGLILVRDCNSFHTCCHHPFVGGGFQSDTNIGVTLCGFPVFKLSRNSGTGQSC